MDNRNSGREGVSHNILVWLAFIILFFVTSPASSDAQSGLIPDKYLKIIPGVSTRADVENLFAKRDPKKHFVDYTTSDFSIGIQYSLGPCELGQGIWGLPEWTVEKVYFYWPEGTKIHLRDIILDRKSFDKRRLGDVLSDDYYVNDEFGISVVYDNNLKSVSSMGIDPSAKLREKYACRTGGK